MDSKIGILTYYYRNFNYGGILQAFALPKAIESLGYDCRQISYKGPAYNGKTKTERWEFLKGTIISFIKKLNWPILKPKIERRYRAFSVFQNEIKHTQEIYSSKTLPQCVPLFDRFICGSDQIWNLKFTRDPSYFLDFVPPFKKKIAFGCSMGMSCLSEKDKAFFERHLTGFDAISVRESHAKTILAELIRDQPIHHVLDPTLLLTREDWDAVCPDRKIKGDYIFYYSFGLSRKQRSLVKQISEKTSLPIVTLPHVLWRFRFCDVNFGDIKSYDDGPDGFVSLIKHAKHIFTDSFHGCVFSYIYHKPFYVFIRHKDSNKRSRNSRIYSLMELLHTENRVVSKDQDWSEMDLEEHIDYGPADCIMAEKRRYSLEYLQKALSE